ncbi:uncharacterized protein LOC103136608 [Poecilia formosa]|uniref:uncharacterized protein LOC103136608 n=1 Tax=Poecilia formosa TaxID=48698 RepID=UPI0007B9406B|nr:PREDICTED: uncharacterized protein LOC103136608 [Poecilia formosa]
MNSPRDQELAPLSRKHRLMAASMPGEDSALPRSTSRADRNGLGGLVHCFICGSGVTPGKELRLQVTYQKERSPFFPFLQNQEPAPGACELSPDGCALVCAVCHCFLTEQWNSFERSRTPIEKRMYWLKRPYQCDSRRVPQEWNISYDLERRISVGSHNYDGGAESDFSSFSENENLSDQEMDLVERVGKDKCLRAPVKFPRDSSRKNNVISIKSSPDSQRAVRCAVGVYDARELPKAESVQPARRGAKIMNVSQSSEAPLKPQERVPQRCCGNSLTDTPVRDNGVIMRNRRWLEEESVRHVEQHQIQRVADSSCAPSSHPSLLHRGRAEGNSSAAPSPVIPKCNSAVAREINSDNSGEDQEINITSDDERDIRGAKAGPTTQLRAASDPSARRVSHHPASSSAEERVCYICGSGLRHGAHFKISVQKQERAQGEPFFPFLWLHSAPRGAVPISPSGTTIVCGSCHSSLMQQWESFQLADVPVLQRLYVVPLNQTSSASGLHPSQHNTLDRRTPGSLEVTPEPKPSHEACFLCGQEGRGDLRVVYAKAGIGKSRAVMYFPFIGLLPCPPNAQAVKNGRVHCCPQCHAILQDIWGAYRLSLSEDLITSVSSFLVRYHSSLSADGSGPVHSQVGVVSRHSSSLSVCYLCGAELSAGAEYQLHVNPPSRFVEREPFFPFLTVYPPAPGAKPVDATGLVSACKLCYHDLHSQWAQHESKALKSSSPFTSGVPGANSHPSSSQWARQYSCEAFVCFFCRQEQHRQGRLCAVTVARLPVFLYAPRSPRMLLVDDGRRLVIGSCVDCKAVVQVGQSMQQDGATPGHGAALGEKSEPELDSPTQKHKASALVSSSTGATKEADSGPSRPARDHTPSCPATLAPERGDAPLPSMSHEPKSPSLGMISTATRTTATVSPLTPSPLNGSIVANGSPAAQSSHSGFAAALRKLAKQAEEPRAASSISSESSPVSSPATNHSSPVSTPKRGPLGPGPVLVPPAGHSVPNTPPVVTIAPTKTSNGLWRNEGRQVN